MEKIFKIIIKLLISGTIVISLSYYFRSELYSILIQEDGLIEYTTALTLLLISVFLFIRLIKIGREKNTKWIVFNMLMILGLFFGFGEEISWGQRIFSIETSDFFLANNLQKETNLHNLTVYGLKINKLIFSYALTFIFGTYFLFSLLLFKKNKYFKNIVNKFGIPIPKIQHTVILFATTIIILVIPDGKKWELWECLFALIFLLVTIEPYNANEKLIPITKRVDR